MSNFFVFAIFRYKLTCPTLLVRIILVVNLCFQVNEQMCYKFEISREFFLPSTVTYYFHVKVQHSQSKLHTFEIM